MSETRNWIYLDEVAEDQPFGTPKRRIIASVRRSGRVRHVLVRRRSDGKYIVVAGHQWVAAARIVGLETLDVVFEEELDALEPLDRKRIVSSLQCESIDHLFIGRCLAQVLEQGGVTQADLAREFGMNRGHVSNLLRVLECPDLEAMMEEEELAFGAAKVLAGLTAEERAPLLRQLRVHYAVHDRFPSVAEITEMVAEVRGEEDTLTLPRRCVRALVEELDVRGREIVVKFGSARRKRIQVLLCVEPADQAWISELTGRKPADRGAASGRAA
jgi:ParB/RepB/Spo0J family partition protein